MRSRQGNEVVTEAEPHDSCEKKHVNAAVSAHARASRPKYAAKVPASITTPDTVQTRIGTLKFSDGLPDADTVKKVYDNLDFVRGVEAFLLGMPAAIVQACDGASSKAASRRTRASASPRAWRTPARCS